MRVWLLYVTVVVLSACGLAYELVAGAASTYLLGDSVTQFASVTGVYLFAMGAGAYATRFVSDPARAYVDCQLGASLVGGLSASVLHVAFAAAGDLRAVLYGLVAASGALVGAELPLLLRVLRRRVALRELVARALTVDYAGALLGSLLVALLVLPRLGLLRTALLFGAANGLCALWATHLLAGSIEPGRLRARAVAVLAVLAGAAIASDRLVDAGDAALFADPVVATRQTPYQRIVLTQGRRGLSLFLDGNLQFSEVDEYRYHEALVHPAFAAAPRRARVLVLGGGDGLAAREILRHADVERVTLVDLDAQMTDLARTLPALRRLNEGSLDSPKLEVIHADAFVWLAEAPPVEPFDVAIVDFPDPNNFALGKLYTVRLYKLLRGRLRDDAVVAVQSTSPLVARRSFWCVVRSLEAAGFFVRPYHALVPTFGEWGFALASARPFDVPAHAPAALRYLTDATLVSLFAWPPDMGPVDVETNRLNDQALVRYYEEEWKR
jgi:spermidine synthase